MLRYNYVDIRNFDSKLIILIKGIFDVKVEPMEEVVPMGLENIEYEPDQNLPIGQEPDVKTEPVDDYPHYEVYALDTEMKEEPEIKEEPMEF